MCSRLERLIRLAGRTGDTLIVHDRHGSDVVLMDVDRYEMLADRTSFDAYSSEASCEEHDTFEDEQWEHHDWEDEEVSQMSERELIDSINHDIGVWRSYHEHAEGRDREHLLEDELQTEPPFDPFVEDYSHAEDWHKVGDVLKTNATYVPEAVSQEDTGVEENDFFSSEVKDPGVPEPKVEPLGEEAFSPSGEASSRNHIPFIDHTDIKEQTKDDASDDEPIFFEEPV